MATPLATATKVMTCLTVTGTVARATAMARRKVTQVMVTVAMHMEVMKVMTMATPLATATKVMTCLTVTGTVAGATAMTRRKVTQVVDMDMGIELRRFGCYIQGLISFQQQACTSFFVCHHVCCCVRGTHLGCAVRFF
eukprot:TRINITY_DN5691_c0_g1_i1.p1 TRINITY_DN5691_c0_g1~~TRINITY_DN5691_c0_g1_i1.p1  ORF type:complete len:138 (+),score=18.50 TRINITY_DN5691_c0_g1_i1:2-415(+)